MGIGLERGGLGERLLFLNVSTGDKGLQAKERPGGEVPSADDSGSEGAVELCTAADSARRRRGKDGRVRLLGRVLERSLERLFAVGVAVAALRESERGVCGEV